MEYITGNNETLNDVAQRTTGTTDFAITIAEFNGLSSPLFQTPLNVPLEPGLLLNIPDSIAKRGMSLEVIGGAIRQSIDWRMIAVGIVAAVVISRLVK